MSELGEVYTKASYFASRLPFDPAREGLWRVVCEYLQPEIPESGDVLELGGGYCHFINNIRARRRHVVDLFPEIVSHAAQDVNVHVGSCTALHAFESSSIDTVFASNLFEHLTREQLLETLTGVKRILKDGGKLLMIQPNFKYSYRTYFDDYTHIQIFTETSLGDLLKAEGFELVKVVPRFLPFSIKTVGPKRPWLLRAYLALPWRPFAGQMYIVARKRRS